MNKEELINQLSEEIYNHTCLEQSKRMRSKEPNKASSKDVSSGFNDLSDMSKQFYKNIAEWYIQKINI